MNAPTMTGDYMKTPADRVARSDEKPMSAPMCWLFHISTPSLSAGLAAGATRLLQDAAAVDHHAQLRCLGRPWVRTP